MNKRKKPPFVETKTNGGFLLCYKCEGWKFITQTRLSVAGIGLRVRGWCI